MAAKPRRGDCFFRLGFVSPNRGMAFWVLRRRPRGGDCFVALRASRNDGGCFPNTPSTSLRAKRSNLASLAVADFGSEISTSSFLHAFC
jgi:hypothetical protein